MIDHHNEKGTITVGDWFQYVSEGAQVSSGIMSFGMMAQSVYDVTLFNYNAHKVQSVPPKVHGNSLYTTKPAQGYALVPRNNPKVILKYGETTMGVNRYSKTYLNNLVPGGADMRFKASGTKYDMHYWQHNMIIDYKNHHNGNRPPFNKSDW